MPNEHMRTAVVKASEKVRRSRCVWMTSDFTVTEMSAASAQAVSLAGGPTPFGIAQEWTRNAPGTPFDTSMEAGNGGDEILVYTNGSMALAECGGTIAAGDFVTATTDARIITTNLTIQPNLSVVTYVLGQAQEAGTTGDVIRVYMGIYAA